MEEGPVIDADPRAKTVMATSTHVELGVLDHRVLLRRHALERSGAVLFSLGEVPPRCALRVAPGADLPVLDLVAVDVSCAHRADRVRGIVRMTGTVDVHLGPIRDDLAEHLAVSDGTPVGRLTPSRVSLEWRIETTDGRPTYQVVEPQDYVAARIDPLGGWEDRWMAHLDEGHRELVRALVSRHLPLGPDARVRPVLADTRGVVMRVEQEGGVHDVRVPFPHVVGCGCEAVQALSTLLRT